MQLSPETIQLLRCPDTNEQLETLDSSAIDNLNQAIETKSLTNRIGQTVAHRLDSALINQSRTWIYSVRSGIVSLIQDEAISAKSLKAQGN